MNLDLWAENSKSEFQHQLTTNFWIWGLWVFSEFPYAADTGDAIDLDGAMSRIRWINRALVVGSMIRWGNRAWVNWMDCLLVIRSLTSFFVSVDFNPLTATHRGQDATEPLASNCNIH